MAKISESTGINSVQLKEQSSAPDTPSSGYAQLFVKSDGLYLKDDGGNVIGPLIKREDYILIKDQKNANTVGGTFTAGAWRTRTLTLEEVDTGGHASIASNQITLAAGTYRCRITCPAFTVANHMTRLYDTTNAAVLVEGSAAYASTYNGQSDSYIVGRFTLTGTAVLEIQHYGSVTIADLGFGVPNNFSSHEIYTVAEFWRES